MVDPPDDTDDDVECRCPRCRAPVATTGLCGDCLRGETTDR